MKMEFRAVIEVGSIARMVKELNSVWDRAMDVNPDLIDLYAHYSEAENSIVVEFSNDD